MKEGARLQRRNSVVTIFVAKLVITFNAEVKRYRGEVNNLRHCFLLLEGGLNVPSRAALILVTSSECGTLSPLSKLRATIQNSRLCTEASRFTVTHKAQTWPISIEGLVCKVISREARTICFK